MIYLYLFGTCFHFIYVFMIIGNKNRDTNFFFLLFSHFYLNFESNLVYLRM